MSDERPSPDSSAQVLRDSLGEVRRSLDALADRLQRLEAAPGGSPPTPGVTPADRPPADRPPADTPPADTPDVRDALSVGQEILAIPSSGLEPAQVFSLAMDRVARLLSADRAMLFLWEPDGSRLVARAGRGFRRDDLETISIKAGDGLVGQAFQDERILRSSSGAVSVAEDPFLALFPVRDAVAVPIRAAGHAAGVLYAGRRTPRPAFSEQDVLLLLVIADRVGTALAHRQFVETTGGHISRLRELEVFLGHVLVGQEMEDMLSRACEVACRLAGVRVAALGVPAGSGGLSLAAASGLPAGVLSSWRADTGYGLTGEMFDTLRPVLCRDIQSRDGCENDVLREAGLRACLVVPVRLRHQTVGALYLADPEAREFTPDEVATVQVLASLLALGMENNRLYGEVRTAFEGMASAQDHLVQTEKARAVGAMAGGIANEFNNLLAIVLGKTQLMLTRAPEGPVREGLAAVEEAAWRAADIVRRLQGFAATSMDEGTGPVDLAAVVQDAVALTRALWKDEAEARGAPIEMVTDLDRVPPVEGQAAALREAVMNLILNAVDAMPRGGRIGLTLRRVDAGVEIHVSDGGEGMPEDVRRRIFDPFFTTRAPHRTGLGLSVVHGVVNRHRGSVRVRSEHGGGTTVTLWFPAAPDHAVESRTPVMPELPEMPVMPETPEISAIPEMSAMPVMQDPPEDEIRAAATVSILVLEDEEHIRTMLVEALSGAGYRVESATDGLTGLARFQGGAFDVVLTDLSLPECSGLDVARSVKRMRPETPVVLITGWGHLLDPERLRDSGVDLMLVKPFRLERVLSVLGDALRLRPTV
ncbi:MAG: GAF domain-containing protein [Candidatus Rokubacteria bacterium]|nr:GAF domain-containing protein [Candidatus Rokubacteria bacterium]